MLILPFTDKIFLYLRWQKRRQTQEPGMVLGVKLQKDSVQIQKPTRAKFLTSISNMKILRHVVESVRYLL